MECRPFRVACGQRTAVMSFNIVVRYRCVWCRTVTEETIPVTRPDLVNEVHVLADEYRTCLACRVKVYRREDANNGKHSAANGQ